MVHENRLLISHPGFSNFGNYFKHQYPEMVILHRNFDLNSLLFKVFRFLKLLPFFKWMNTRVLILTYKKMKCNKLIIFKGISINYKILDSRNMTYTIYLWDSIINTYEGKKYIEMNDRVLTFDLADSIQYRFKYLPLFHFRGETLKDKDFETAKRENRNRITIYGNYSKDRVNILDQIINNNQGPVEVIHILTISLYTFIKEIFTGNQSFKILWQYTTFKKLTRKKIEDLLNCSCFTLDISNTSQTGMTTRTFEALSYSTKLVTNNQTSARFCETMGIPVLYNDFKDGLSIESINSFKNEEFSITPQFIKEYSITSFLNKIINSN